MVSAIRLPTLSLIAAHGMDDPALWADPSFATILSGKGCEAAVPLSALTYMEGVDEITCTPVFYPVLCSWRGRRLGQMAMAACSDRAVGDTMNLRPAEAGNEGRSHWDYARTTGSQGPGSKFDQRCVF